jgi:Family of unknown function (DUF5681)
MTDNDDDEVGYGKPPKKHQFKKGQSGNPRGRPKGTKNLKTDLIEEFGEQIALLEGGKKQRISKQRALIKSLVTRAIKGNDRAAAKSIDLYLRMVGIEDEASDASAELTDDERAVMKTLEERIRRRDHAAENADTDKSESP